MAKHSGGKSSRTVPRKKRRAVQTFAQALDAADQLSPEDQEELIAILRRRLTEAGRKRIAAEAQESYEEFKQGLCRRVTPAELMREILE